METIKLQVGDIKPYERNAKKHDERQIKNVMESIKQFGFVQPIVVDKDHVVIIGHCRLIAAKRLKMREVDCVVADQLSQADVDRLRLLDNKLNESEWDIDLLLEDIPDLDFSDFDIDWGLPEDISTDSAEIVEDEPPELPDIPKAKLGDLYEIGGAHRLICGDSTDPATIERLMDGAKADLLITDPPYNVALGMNGSHPLRPSEAKQLHRRTDGKIIQNDSWESDEEFIEFLVKAYNSALNVMKAGAIFYIWYASTQAFNFLKACKDADMQVRQTLIWNKSVFAFGRQDYQWKHEPCLYGWKEGAGHLWYSDRKQTTVLDFDKPSRSDIHPTMKPVALFAYQIQNSTKGDDCVLDLFGGSGTTMIACEQLHRKSYLCELDPRYVDAIVQRYINLKGTDEDVFLIRDGERIPYKDVM